MANIWQTKLTVAHLHEEADGDQIAYAGEFGGVTLAVRRDPAADGDDPAYRLRVETSDRARAKAVRDAMIRATGKEPPGRKPPALIKLARLYRKRSSAGRTYFAGRLNGMRIVLLDDGGGRWRLMLQPGTDVSAERARSALHGLEHSEPAVPETPISGAWLQ
jgi:hypothetical protein